MKNKFVAIFASFVLAFTFTGCGDTGSPEPVEVTVTASPTPDAGGTTESLFPQVIRDNTNDFDHADDTTINNLAKQMCEVWDTGASFTDIAAMMLESGFSVDDAGFFIGAGTEAYCPEYTSNITSGNSI